jgi:tRNA1(Val) A37 N6-methylase TrmN6
LKQFDYVVANPPFSQKNWKTGFDADNDLYGRFMAMACRRRRTATTPSCSTS